MQAAEALERLGGVADAARLRRVSSRRAIRRAVRKGEIVRDARGRYALPTAEEAVRAANALTAVVSHASAATYWGWELKQPPPRPTVTVPRNRNVPSERRSDVDVKWAHLGVHEISNGIVTTPGRTVMDCAKSMPFDEALAIADSALRHRNVTKARLLQLAEQVHGPGRARCLRVARHADGRAANPFESVLRAIALEVRGLEVVPQLVIEEGGHTARPDLVDERRRLVVEAESFEWHGRRRQLKKDCERYNALTLRGWRVLRFSWEHVMFEPAYVADCLRAAVASVPLRRAEVTKSRRIPA